MAFLGFQTTTTTTNNQRLLHCQLPLLLLLLLSIILNADRISGAQLVQVMDFGYNNPNGTLQMFEYVPDNVAGPFPALVVVMHGCMACMQQSVQYSDWNSLADQYGFIVVYVQSTHNQNCFDVFSAQGLQRDGGSDSQTIVAMVQYEVRNRSVDPARVYAMGFSSGGMMTNVLVAEYPDVFAAGSAFYAGPYTCFATNSSADTTQPKCAHGEVILTAQEWGDRVRAADPGYRGRRSRMQLWHGTNDSVVYYALLAEEVKQWTNVWGLGQQPFAQEQLQIVVNGQNVSAVRARYDLLGSLFGGPLVKVEAITMDGLDHLFPAKGIVGLMVAHFFGLIPPELPFHIGNSQPPPPDNLVNQTWPCGAVV